MGLTRRAFIERMALIGGYSTAFTTMLAGASDTALRLLGSSQLPLCLFPRANILKPLIDRKCTARDTQHYESKHAPPEGLANLPHRSPSLSGWVGASNISSLRQIISK